MVTWNKRSIGYVALLLILMGGVVSAVNTSQVTDQAKNITEEGKQGLVNDVSNFLSTTSPAFLIILGIILIVGSKFSKIIGYILIVFAIIRLLFSLL